jgi:hypothetical protein
MTYQDSQGWACGTLADLNAKNTSDTLRYDGATLHSQARVDGNTSVGRKIKHFAQVEFRHTEGAKVECSPEQSA